MSRIEVVKTGKLWIGGKWPRSESGATFAVEDAAGRVIARCAQASRKDTRDAVEAARSGHAAWSAATPLLRGQVLYRAAEMLEGRMEECVETLRVAGGSAAAARREVAASVDRMVLLAGWCDKIHQLLGCQNAVAGPYHNFTIPQSTGVVGVICPSAPVLLPMVTLIGAALVGGNSVVAVVPPPASMMAVLLGEMLAVSDVPDGVVNLLTGPAKPLLEPLGGHREVPLLVAAGLSKSDRVAVRTAAADGLRRVHMVPWTGDAWDDGEAASPWFLSEFVEFKTLWHPSGS